MIYFVKSKTTGFIWAFAYIFTPSFSVGFSLIEQSFFKMKAFSESLDYLGSNLN